LRRAELIGCRWGDLDLFRGRARIQRKGQHWHWLPLDREVVTELRSSFRQLQPELDDHVFQSSEIASKAQWRTTTRSSSAGMTEIALTASTGEEYAARITWKR
jgi:integrase